MLRGTIDLLVEARGMTWVVDFKTDRLSDGVPAELPAHYALQRDLYAAAVTEATGAEAVRAAYVFLEAPESPIVAALDRAAIAAGRERVEAVVSDIRASRFGATPTPHIELCHDCPARDRLCPHPKELTGRAGGAASTVLRYSATGRSSRRRARPARSARPPGLRPRQRSTAGAAVSIRRGATARSRRPSPAPTPGRCPSGSSVSEASPPTPRAG